MNKIWKKISSKTVYKNPWIEVKEDKVLRPDGKKGIYGVIDTLRSVIILAIEGDDIYLVRQYRYPAKKSFLELCMGSNHGHEKDTTLQLAKNELREELGLVAKKWKMIGKFYPCNALLNEISYVYVAEDFIARYENNLDEDEFLDVVKMPFKKFAKLVESGKIDDAYTLLAYYKYKEYKKI